MYWAVLLFASEDAVCSGDKLAFPVGIAPMSMQRMAHPDGELAVASAAAKAGIPMVICQYWRLTH